MGTGRKISKGGVTKGYHEAQNLENKIINGIKLLKLATVFLFSVKKNNSSPTQSMIDEGLGDGVRLRLPRENHLGG